MLLSSQLEEQQTKPLNKHVNSSHSFSPLSQSTIPSLFA